MISGSPKYNHSETVVLSLSFLSMLTLFLFPIQNFDIFWHMANGRSMIEEGSIIQREVFSYTVPGVHFSNHEWLAQILFYLTHELTGATGLMVLKLTIASLIFLVLYKTSRTFGLGKSAAAVLVLLAFTAGATRFTVRPQLFSFLFLSLLSYIFFASRGGRLKIKYLYLAPAVFLLWDTLHGAVYGLVLWGSLVTGETLSALAARRLAHISTSRAFLKTLWLSTLITLAVIVISPFGLREYGVFLIGVTSPDLSVLLNREYAPTPLGEFHLFWLLLALSWISTFIYIKKADLSVILVLISFSALALKYNRAVTAFSLVAVVVLSRHMGLYLVRDLSARARTTGKVLLYAALIMTVTAIGVIKFNDPSRPLYMGYGIDGKRHPVGAVRFMKQNSIEGNIYNKGRYGGILAFYLYPEKRIFMYNHGIVFGKLQTETQSRAFLDKYGITHALIFEDAWSDLLFLRDQWVPVYWDTSSTLLVRDTEQNRPFIEKHGLRFFTPRTTQAEVRMYESSPSTGFPLASDIARILSYNRNPGLADYLGGLMAGLSPYVDPKAGIELIESALVYNRESAPLWVAAGKLYDASGDRKKAGEALSRAKGLGADIK